MFSSKRVPSLTPLVQQWLADATLRSEDPNHQVGCIFVSKNGRELIGSGANQFPPGTVVDSQLLSNKTRKRLRVQHAELSAVLSVGSPRASLPGSTAYVTHPPCAACAGLMISLGVARVVYYTAPEGRMLDYRFSFDEAATMFREAGVVTEVMT